MNKKVTEKTEFLNLEEIKKQSIDLNQKTEVLDLKVLELNNKFDKVTRIIFNILIVLVILFILIILLLII